MSNPIDSVLADNLRVGPVASPHTRSTPSGRRPNASRVGTEHEIRRADEARPISSQSVTAGPGSEISDVQQVTILDLTDREFFFMLDVLEVTGARAALPLEAGHKYLVSVTRGLNRYQSAASLPHAGEQVDQRPVKARDTLTLLLETSPDWDITTAGQGAPMPLQAHGEWSHHFELTLPRDRPADRLTLTLMYGEGQQGRPNLATSLEVAVTGGQASLPAEVKRYYLPLDAELPPRTAILRIQPADDEHLALVGWLRDTVARRLALAPIRRPSLPPDSLDGEIYQDRLHQAIHDLAQNNPANVRAWLEDVLQLYGDGCTVVVVDRADSRVPWEMLRLSGNRYLGTVARIVRWTETEYFSRPIALLLGEKDYTGRLAAYVHPNDSAHLAQRLPLLATLVPSPLTDPGDLEADLYGVTETEPVGLVYLGSHTLLVSGDEAADLVDVSSCHPNPIAIGFSLATLTLGDVAWRPVFVVNAPHSGRVLRRASGQCGLVHTALRDVAAGYIGVLGPVDAETAAHVAERLLAEAVTRDGVQPADLLLTLRREALGRLTTPRLSPDQRRAALRRLVAICLYVYYGNPQARVKVTGLSGAVSSSEDADE